MQEKQNEVGPEHTAVRVALWRALHKLVDAPPHVIDDEVGLRITAPDDGWRQRPDMSPEGTKRYRAAIVGRARFLDDFVAESAGRGIDQYVILGAGLDTFAQRKADVATKLDIFEVDQPGPQTWKRRRLAALGLDVGRRLHLVPVNFEAGGDWWKELTRAGLDPKRRAVVSSTGVIMYLTLDAITATLRQVAKLAPGSHLAMTFMLPIDLMDAEERPGMAMTMKYAAAAGTPILSFFSPEQITRLARDAGFGDARVFSEKDMIARYFAGRSDDFRPSNAEQMLVATV